MTPLQTSILATLDEIAKTQKQLGIPGLVDPDDRAEAWFIVERIEAQWAKRNEAAE